jgi:tetratricopeptide (TPR) repeat protein
MAVETKTEIPLTGIENARPETKAGDSGAWDPSKLPLDPREFKRAIELNPNYATAHFWYGEHLTYLGRFDEAIAEIGRAEELDPLSPIISGSIG